MYEYKVEQAESYVGIQSILNKCAQLGWRHHGTVYNSMFNNYIVIFERERLIQEGVESLKNNDNAIN